MRARVRTLISLLVLAACCCGGYQQVPPQVALEREAVVLAALARWESLLGPLSRCRAESALLRWETASVAELAEQCRTSSTLTGCFHYDGDEPVITLAEDTPRSVEQLTIVRFHEATHWMLICSGVDRTGDPMHTRDEVWRGLL